MRKGQVWVETVVYTLIGLSLIAVVLTIVTPKINEYKDRAVIEQTISAMDAINSEIEETLSGAQGNSRVVEFGMKKGEFYVDKDNEKLYFTLEESSVLYSEPGQGVKILSVNVTTSRGVKRHAVNLTLNYEGIADIDFDGDETLLELSSSSVPYKFRFEKGENNLEGIPIVRFSTN